MTRPWGGANSQINVTARLDAWHRAFSGVATTLSGLLGRVRATSACAPSLRRFRASQNPGDPPGLWDRSGAWAEPCRPSAPGPTVHRSKVDPAPGKRARLGCGRMFHKGRPGEVNRPLQGHRVTASRAVSALGLRIQCRALSTSSGTERDPFEGPSGYRSGRRRSSYPQERCQSRSSGRVESSGAPTAALSTTRRSRPAGV